MAIVIPQPSSLPVTYPESDGQPMAETDIHRDQMVYLIETLKDYFRDDPQVYVAGNLFIYCEEGHPEAVVAPDVFVVMGVPKRNRRIYKVWEERKGPDLVVEVTSKSTRWEDVGTKRGIYASLGVQEYILYDPLADYLSRKLQGYRLSEGEYLPMSYESVSDGILRLRSEVVGLVFHAEGEELWLYDPQTGRKLLSPAESYEAYRAEAEARRATEEEVARLRSELARLQHGRR